MKVFKFFLIFALFFFVACDDGATRIVPEENGGESVTDGDENNDEDVPDSEADTADSDSDGDITDTTDTSDSGDDSDTADTSDSGNDSDTADTSVDGDTSDSGNDSDTADTSDTGDDSDTVPDVDPESDEGKCIAAGGEWDAFAEDETERCYKIEDCASKPEYTEWRGEQSWVEYYDLEDGLWTHFGQNYNTEYNDSGEPKVCDYVCAENAVREDDECKPYCSAVFNGSSSKIEVAHNDLLNLEHFWTIEAWVKQDDMNINSLSGDAKYIARKGDSYYLTNFYKTTTGRRSYYNMKGSFEYAYKNNFGIEQTDDFSVTAQYQSNAAGLPIETDGWNHVALSYYIKEGTAHLRLYINGQFANEETGKTNDYAPKSVSEALTIGYYLDKGMQIMPGGDSTIGDKEYFFKGKIAQLKIKKDYYSSDDPFTPSQLSVDDNTIAFYDFSGNADDSSGKGLNGTQTNVIYDTDCPLF